MSRELLKQCLDLITDLDKEGLILESGLIFALRNELAKPEQEPVAWRNAAIRLGEDLYSVGPNGYYDMTAKQWLDWALSVVNTAQPEQEPYCWVQSKLSQGMFYKEKPRRIHTIPLYTAPPRNSEQIITPISIDQYERVCFTCGACVGKPWVGLNAKDLSEIPPSCFEGAIWADGKLKEKNI